METFGLKKVAHFSADQSKLVGFLLGFYFSSVPFLFLFETSAVEFAGCFACVCVMITNEILNPGCLLVNLCRLQCCLFMVSKVSLEKHLISEVLNSQ